MTRSRQLNHDSQQGSDYSDEDSDGRSPPRGRKGKVSNEREERAVDAQIDAMMDENSKASGA